jgi:glutathione S-transferase
MKFYTDPGSGSCRRVQAVIDTLGLEVEEVFIDLLQGANRTPEFLALNPNGMVPVLVDGDIVMWEAGAIMVYLCEKAGPTTLLPEGAARFDVLRWMLWAGEHFRQSAPIYFEEKFAARFMGQPANSHRLAEADTRIARFAPILEAHLETRQVVVGGKVTLADFDLAAPLSQMPRTGVPYQRFPNIMRWYQHLTDTVPAWRETGIRLDHRLDSAAEGAGI